MGEDMNSKDPYRPGNADDFEFDPIGCLVGVLLAMVILGWIFYWIT